MQDPICDSIENQPRPSVFSACGLVLLAGVGLWISSLIDVALAGSGALLLNAAYYLPFIALPMLLYARGHAGLSRAMRLNPLPASAVLYLAPLALLSVFVASALTAAWGAGLDALGLREVASAPLPQTRSDLAMAIISMAALPAVCEELLFRGFALAAWERRGTRFAVAVCAALFALLHGNLYGLPAYLLVGALAGVATWALDSVYAGIVYHTFYNSACLVLSWLARDMAAAEAAGDVQTLPLALQALAMSGMAGLLVFAMLRRAWWAGVESIPDNSRPMERRDRLMLWAAVAELAISMIVVAALAARGAAA